MTAAVPPTSGARRALLIGVDEYTSPKIRDLQGCVNDVRLMRSLLVERFEFPEANVTVLESRRAGAEPEPGAEPRDVPTREAILAAFRRLLESTGTDDVVVIHYAGHGAQVTDREGDEAGYYDSTIMPCDSEGWSGVNRDITDDEIHLLLVDLGKRTSYVTLIVDACHSGTITRDTVEEMTRGMPADTRPVAELPPSPIPPERLADLRGAGGTRGARDAAPSRWLPPSEQYVLIAGCRDAQTSKEYTPPEGGGKVKHGALTYFLVNAIKESEPGATYRDVFERAATRVTGRYPDQHPQIEGARDRVLFGVVDRPPMRHVRVVARAGSRVTLAAGAALGATEGSEYDVFTHGTTSTAQAERRIGRVRIAAVRPTTSDAEIVSEPTAGAIAVDARAFEVSHAWSSMKLPVKLLAAPGGALDAHALDAHALDAHAAAMRGAIGASALLQLVDADSTSGGPRVHLLAPRPGATDDDPVPQLGRLDAPTWAIEGADGRLLAPRKSLDEAPDVVTNLEIIARHRNALALENPVAESRLRGRFTLTLLRQAAETPDGPYEPPPRDAGGRMVFEEGDRLDVRIEQVPGAPDEPVYVNLLDFGLTGSISPLYPPVAGAADPLQRKKFEVRRGQDLKGWLLKMPKGFPFADDVGHAAAAEGVETLKLFVTSKPVDFSYLRQEGTRNLDAPAATGMGRLFATAMARPGTRDLEDDDEATAVEPGEDWTTVSESFVLRRRVRQPLDAAGAPVALGAATVRTEGVTGTATMRVGPGAVAGGDGRTPDPLAQALGAEGASVAQTIEIGGTRAAEAGTRGGPPSVELAVRAPEPGLGQMVLGVDASGAMSWHFAPTADDGVGTRGDGPAARRYAIPLTGGAPAVDDGEGARGVLGALGGEAVKHALKVVVFPLVDPVLGAVGEGLARSWEEKHRPYRVRTFTPENYTLAPAAVDVDGGWWRARGARGSALLFVHGTFSRSDAAFGDLPRAMMESLHARYDGRVLAFDHHTLSDGPATNVDELVARLRLPDDADLDLDVVSHSRGGLVSRMLVERQGELSAGGRRVRVRNVVFVGAPNAGTALADPERIGALVDRFTTLLSAVPSGGAAEVLAGVVTVVKMLAVGAFKGLPGLSVMQETALKPDGAFLKALAEATNGNGSAEHAAATRYFALTSDYDPVRAGVKALVANRMVDLFFGAGNDTVVPTEGVWSAAGRGFPIAEGSRVKLERGEAVPHTAFFGSAAVHRKLDEWLRP